MQCTSISITHVSFLVINSYRKPHLANGLNTQRSEVAFLQTVMQNVHIYFIPFMPCSLPCGPYVSSCGSSCKKMLRKINNSLLAFCVVYFHLHCKCHKRMKKSIKLILEKSERKSQGQTTLSLNFLLARHQA